MGKDIRADMGCGYNLRPICNVVSAAILHKKWKSPVLSPGFVRYYRLIF
jgi:hypothetical protein